MAIYKLENMPKRPWYCKWIPIYEAGDIIKFPNDGITSFEYVEISQIQWGGFKIGWIYICENKYNWDKEFANKGDYTYQINWRGHKV